jgi:hypothetical protein
MKTSLLLYVSAFLLSYAKYSEAQVVPGSVVEESIDSYLSTPAVNYVKQIPVVVIRYMPTTNGIDLDVSQATDYWSLGKITLNNLISNIDKYDKRVKFSLEEGSRYHGYKDSQAVPYLGYKVIKYISVYRQVYISDFMLGTEGGKNVYQPDYKREFDSLNLKSLITQNHVKEVWMWYGEAARPGWPSYSASLHGNIQKYVSFVESNMASPSTGDISNSFRFANDLYILDSTYVVYCQNFRRSQAEAVHNHGHQLESIYKHVANRQDGNISMFVQKFSGWGDNNYKVPPFGRAGDTHHPPNTTSDYDYLNTTLVQSDIEDWKPAGGIKKAVNVDTWGKLSYAWPGGTDFSQRVESQWYIYWMQNMPRYNNGIPYEQYMMTNWWQFTPDWDLCNARNIGLYAAITGIADEPGPAFSLYPNPCRDRFAIQCSALLVKAIEIVDLCGNRIAVLPVSGSINGRIEFDISFLKPGVYFIRISADNQWFVRRLIKI